MDKYDMNHEMLQFYFDRLYTPFEHDIKKSLSSGENELYGEIYYYSALPLLTYLKISETDCFLDIGSGFGKLAFQVFLTTKAASVIGVEINTSRHEIAHNIRNTLEKELPDMFFKRSLELILGDFLKYSFNHITIIYMCSTVFSFDLLNAIGKKIDDMDSVEKVVSFRKVPQLSRFKLTKKMFLHCSWDKVPCFIYTRKY